MPRHRLIVRGRHRCVVHLPACQCHGPMPARTPWRNINELGPLVGSRSKRKTETRQLTSNLRVYPRDSTPNVQASGGATQFGPRTSHATPEPARSRIRRPSVCRVPELWSRSHENEDTQLGRRRWSSSTIARCYVAPARKGTDALVSLWYPGEEKVVVGWEN